MGNDQLSSMASQPQCLYLNYGDIIHTHIIHPFKMYTSVALVYAQISVSITIIHLTILLLFHKETLYLLAATSHHPLPPSPSPGQPPIYCASTDRPSGRVI